MIIEVISTSSKMIKYKIKSTLQMLKTKLISDERFICQKYKKRFLSELKFNNPQTFNEKINVMKINDAAYDLSLFVDKYHVRDYIRQKIGEEYLVEIFGVHDYISRELFNSFPDQFIIKGVHGVSMNYICNKKNQVSYENLEKKINKWLNRNAYYVSREKQYKNIEPKYIVEKLMQTQNGKCPDDYKFHCFNGKIQFVSVVSSRFDEDYSFTNFDENGKVMPFSYNGPRNDKVESIDISFFKPIVEILAADFKFVRVDLYYFENQIKFGELTFTPFNGMGLFDPSDYDFKFGRFLNIEDSKSFLKD